MSVIFSLVMFLAITLAPGDVTKIDLTMNNGRSANGKSSDRTIQLTKNDDDRWTAIDLPKDQLGIFSAKDMMLNMYTPSDEGQAKPYKVNIGTMFGLDKAPDWATVETLKIEDKIDIAIAHNDNGFTISFKQEGKVMSSFSVEWISEEKEE